MSARLLLGAAVCAALIPTAPARAAGPPLPSSSSGKAGAVAPGGSERLSAHRAGQRPPVVVATRRHSRRPSCAHDTSPAAGASPGDARRYDDRACRPTAARSCSCARRTHFPPRSTSLAVLDAHALAVRRRDHAPRLLHRRRGLTRRRARPSWSSTPRDDILDYRVRALDTRTGRFAAGDVVDPREPEEQMGGAADDARGQPRRPLGLHALRRRHGDSSSTRSTRSGRTAACIDLEMLPPEADLSAAAAARQPGTAGASTSAKAGTLVATVDARTFAVSEPGAPAATPPAAPAARTGIVPPADDNGLPWPALVLVASTAGVSAAALFARRHRRLAPAPRDAARGGRRQ